jgi:type II secretory pathway component PulM
MTVMGELSTDEKTVYRALLHPGEVATDSWVSALTRMKAERTRLEREYGIALDLLRQAGLTDDELKKAILVRSARDTGLKQELIEQVEVPIQTDGS